MRALSGATTVGRVLMGLDRSGASGTLYVRGEGRSAILWLDSSQVVGANVDRRVAISDRQLLESVSQMCGWEGLVLRLLRSPAGWTWPRLDNPLSARILALRTMRAAVDGASSATVRAELGASTYHLTRIGEGLSGEAELSAEEAAAALWLRRGVAAEEMSALPGCGYGTHRFVLVLKLLGAAAPKAGGSYPLLLRKRIEVRRQAPAHALLDLPAGAGGRDARLALRKLVRDLHPDRFGDGVAPALRRASGEIMTALVNAEARIASGRL
ncbi:MAG: J domain-containing protein [Polyangiales bacterium]|jgi:hypothetical protein